MRIKIAVAALAILLAPTLAAAQKTSYDYNKTTDFTTFKTYGLKDGTKVTVFLRKPPLRESGLLPKGGVARFYGIAQIFKSGAAYEEVWRRLVQPEKDRDPDKKGFAVLIKVERAEDLDGKPLDLV